MAAKIYYHNIGSVPNKDIIRLVKDMDILARHFSYDVIVILELHLPNSTRALAAASAYWQVVDNTENVTIFIRKQYKPVPIVHRSIHAVSFTFRGIVYTVAYMNPFHRKTDVVKQASLADLTNHLDTVMMSWPQSAHPHIFMADVNITIKPHTPTVNIQHRNRYPDNGRQLLACLQRHRLFPKHTVTNGHDNYLDICMAPPYLSVESNAITHTGEQIYPKRNIKDHTRVCYKVQKMYVVQRLFSIDNNCTTYIIHIICYTGIRNRIKTLRRI